MKKIIIILITTFALTISAKAASDGELILSNFKIVKSLWPIKSFNILSNELNIKPLSLFNDLSLCKYTIFLFNLIVLIILVIH